MRKTTAVLAAILIAALPVMLWAAIAFVQAQPSTNATTCSFTAGFGTSVTCALAANATAGSSIVVSVAMDGSATLSSISSSQGLTYVQGKTWLDSTATRHAYLYVASGASAAGETVTIVVSSAQKVDIHVLEYSGLAAVTSAGDLDGTSTDSTDSATPGCGSITTTNANDVVVAALFAAGTSSITATGSGTLRSVQNNGSGRIAGGVSDQILSATATVSPTWLAVGESRTYCGAMALKQAGSVAAKVRHKVISQ